MIRHIIRQAVNDIITTAKFDTDLAVTTVRNRVERRQAARAYNKVVKARAKLAPPVQHEAFSPAAMRQLIELHRTSNPDFI